MLWRLLRAKGQVRSKHPLCRANGDELYTRASHSDQGRARCKSCLRATISRRGRLATAQGRSSSRERNATDIGKFPYRKWNLCRVFELSLPASAVTASTRSKEGLNRTRSLGSRAHAVLGLFPQVGIA